MKPDRLILLMSLPIVDETGNRNASTVQSFSSHLDQLSQTHKDFVDLPAEKNSIDQLGAVEKLKNTTSSESR